MRILKTVLLWLAIISGAVVGTILLSVGLFPLFVHFDHLDQIANLSFGRLNQNYWQLMLYLVVPWISPLKMRDFPVSISGAHHFADVKNLFVLALIVLIVTIVPAIRYWHQLRQQHRRYVLVRPFQIGAVVPVILGALMAINFDEVFVTFHHILFRNSDWLFDPVTDPVINVLPEDFFLACFIVALLLFEIVMGIGIWRGKQDSRR